MWSNWRRWDPFTAAAVLAAAVFVLLGIGAPLVGKGVFAGTAGLTTTSPYADAGLAGTPVTNTYLNDTYDSMLPAANLYADTLAAGDPAQWNPYITGGAPLSATPNYALYSPLMLPHYLLPDWLAPAYTKLFELVVAILGCALFLRRLGLRWVSGLAGGVVFASSAFMVVWTNWPQTQVAAMIPWVFWAAEGIARRRRAVDAVALAGAFGVMLLAGFPAVAVYTGLTVAAYLGVRLLAQRRSPTRPLALAGLGVGGAVALAAVQLLPFAYFLSSWYIENRVQGPGSHLSPAYLVTMFAPWAYGGVRVDEPDRPFWYLNDNFVEASSYLGAAALVLVLTAVVLARQARAALPSGAWLALAGATGGWVAIIFTSIPMTFLVHAPVFSTNFIGRGRSVLGFLLAVLAAVGLDLVLRRRAERVRPLWTYTVVGLGAVVLVALVLRARWLTGIYDDVHGGTLALDTADREIAIGVALLVASAATVVALLRLRHRTARVGAGIVLFGLIVGQALSFVGPYWPRSDRNTFYPVTDTHEFLAANLGDERFLGTPNGMFGTNSSYGLRSLSGHTFVNRELAALLLAVPHSALPSPTYAFFDPYPDQAASPILDRLAGKYLVASPTDPMFGETVTTHTDGATLTLNPLQTVVTTVPTNGPLRAIGFVPMSGPVPALSPDSYVEVEIRGPDGRTLARGHRITKGLGPGLAFLVPVAGEDIPAGTELTAAITLHGPEPLTVAGIGVPTAPGEVPASAGPSTMDQRGGSGIDLAPVAVTPGGDRFKLVYAGSTVIYERLDALPRIRWASSTVVEPDRDRRVALLGAGTLADDQVVLNQAGPAASGQGAEVRVVRDGTDEIEVRVDARGAGYLVVADAIQVGWAAEIDGQPAPLLPADQAVVALAVGPGVHTVRLHYASPYHGVGGWISLAALLTAGAVIALSRRKPTPPPESAT